MTRLIPLSEAREGMVTANHIFSPGERGGTPLVPQNTLLTRRLLDNMIARGIVEIPIKITLYHGVNIEEPPPIEPVVSEEMRAEAIGGIQQMFLAVGEGATDGNMTTAYQAVKEINSVVDRLVDTLTADPRALVHIENLKSYDEYTYHHSLSVAVLSIAIGQSLGFTNEKLRLLGRCAMMHDIGKTLVPVEIINKPARLSDAEFIIVKKHTSNGYEYLSESHIGDDAFWEGVLGHHEKIDGSGYPNGLKGNEIPLLSRIIAVADVYDALTSYRSYRSPAQPAEAMEMIMGDVGRAFDYDIAKAFLSKLELYPVNSVVMLSNGKAAVVVRNENAARPVVRIADTGDFVDLSERSYLNITITRVLEDLRTLRK